MPDQPLIAAYCDVDGTLTRTTIVTPLSWLKRRLLCAPQNLAWQASLLFRGPWWLALDKRDRNASNRAIYSHYRGMSVDRVRELAEPCWRECLRPRLYPKAAARLEEFRNKGIRLVLVTGGLDLFMEPMAREFGADCIAPGLEERDGVFTGELAVEPLVGPRKSEAVRAHAAKHNVDLKKSFALGDALGDLAMLECVGHPIAVNPGRRMTKVATERGWPIERWG